MGEWTPLLPPFELLELPLAERWAHQDGDSDGDGGQWCRFLALKIDHFFSLRRLCEILSKKAAIAMFSSIYFNKRNQVFCLFLSYHFASFWFRRYGRVRSLGSLPINRVNSLHFPVHYYFLWVQKRTLFSLTTKKERYF